MRRMFVLLLAGAALTIAGCGDDGKIEATGSTTTAAPDDSSDTGGDEGDDGGSGGTGASSPEAQALADDLLGSGMGVDEESANCAANAMVDGLTAEGVAVVQNDETDMTDLSEADQAVVVEAFNDCIDIATMAEPAVEAFAGSSGIELTDEEASCGVEALGSEIGGAGDFLVLSMGDEADAVGPILNAIGGCLNTDTLVAFLTNTFSQDGTMDETTATCISQALVGEFGGTELLKSFAASADGSMPADLETAVTTATTTCAAGG